MPIGTAISSVIDMAMGCSVPFPSPSGSRGFAAEYFVLENLGVILFVSASFYFYLFFNRSRYSHTSEIEEQKEARFVCVSEGQC